MRKLSVIIYHLSFSLALAFVVLVLLSWLLSATMGDGVHSLLSAEGIRFFFGGFVDMVRQPMLVWLLLLAMAWGCMRQSGLIESLTILRPFVNKQTKAEHVSLGGRRTGFLLTVILALYVGILLLLTATPHAVLLSATGRLWPSPFSRALVPVVAFCLILLSAVYGIATRRFLSVAEISQSMASGIATFSSLFLFYVLLMQFCASFRFVFGL